MPTSRGAELEEPQLFVFYSIPPAFAGFMASGGLMLRLPLVWREYSVSDSLAVRSTSTPEGFRAGTQSLVPTSLFPRIRDHDSRLSWARNIRRTPILASSWVALQQHLSHTTVPYYFESIRSMCGVKLLRHNLTQRTTGYILHEESPSSVYGARCSPGELRRACLVPCPSLPPIPIPCSSAT